MNVNDRTNESPERAEKSVLPAVNPHSVDIEEQVKRIMEEKPGIYLSQIKHEASFSDDLGIDSLDVFELIIEIENVFHLSISSEEAERLTTPGRLIDYIKNAGATITEDS